MVEAKNEEIKAASLNVCSGFLIEKEGEKICLDCTKEEN